MNPDFHGNIMYDAQGNAYRYERDHWVAIYSVRPYSLGNVPPNFGTSSSSQEPRYANWPAPANATPGPTQSHRALGSSSLSPNATPRARPAIPVESTIRGFNDPRAQHTQLAYQNYQEFQDRDGTAHRAADGPRERITDPELQRAQIYSSRILMATPGKREPLDQEYKKRDRPKEFFKVGKVFLVLWAEPAANASSSTEVTIGPYDEPIYSKIRRFVVVREGPNYCSAVPIMTYRSQGVGKPGVKKSEHVVVHTGRNPPQPLDTERPAQGEMGMRPKAIRVDPVQPTFKLDPISRINLGKIMTVEHYVKCKPFGMVTALQDLVYQWRDVWFSQVEAGPSPRSCIPSIGPGDPTVQAQAQTMATSPTRNARTSPSSAYALSSSVPSHQTATRAQPLRRMSQGQTMGQLPETQARQFLSRVPQQRVQEHDSSSDTE